MTLSRSGFILFIDSLYGITTLNYTKTQALCREKTHIP